MFCTKWSDLDDKIYKLVSNIILQKQTNNHNLVNIANYMLFTFSCCIATCPSSRHTQHSI